MHDASPLPQPNTIEKAVHIAVRILSGLTRVRRGPFQTKPVLDVAGKNNHLEPPERCGAGADRGALLLKELPPTRPPDRAARASPGTAAPSKIAAARAAAAGAASLLVK